MSGAQACAILMIVAVFAALPFGFPVGFTLVGVSLATALIARALGFADTNYVAAVPFRLMGLMENDLLQAMPLFVYFGVILQRTALSSAMIDIAGQLFGARPGGLALATIAIAALLAPTTGAVGATVLTLAMLALPKMLGAGYQKRLAVGLVTAAGTYGTVLPPSIILIILADLMRGARSEAQGLGGAAQIGAFNVTDIYKGMLLPVALIIAAHVLLILVIAWRAPASMPPAVLPASGRPSLTRVFTGLVLPAAFLAGLLGSIILGYVYTVEAAAFGALVATLFAFAYGGLTLAMLMETCRQTMKLTAMIFLLLIGASTFSLVFRGLNGHVLIYQWIQALPFGAEGAVAIVFAVIFIFGFFLDALEILTLAVPIAMPPLLVLGADPVWLAVLAAITVQTSFLIPPSGFALFFMRSVAPREVTAGDIYRGVVPFIGVQLIVLAALWRFPALATGAW